MPLRDQVHGRVERRLAVVNTDEVRLQRRDPPVDRDERDLAAHLLHEGPVAPVGIGVKDDAPEAALQGVAQVRGLARRILFLAANLPQAQEDRMVASLRKRPGSCPRRSAPVTSEAFQHAATGPHDERHEA